MNNSIDIDDLLSELKRDYTIDEIWVLQIMYTDDNKLLTECLKMVGKQGYNVNGNVRELRRRLSLLDRTKNYNKELQRWLSGDKC